MFIGGRALSGNLLGISIRFIDPLFSSILRIACRHGGSTVVYSALGRLLAGNGYYKPNHHKWTVGEFIKDSFASTVVQNIPSFTHNFHKASDTSIHHAYHTSLAGHPSRCQRCLQSRPNSFRPAAQRCSENWG